MLQTLYVLPAFSSCTVDTILICIQTRTFPISGKFSKESREIYDIVLQMQKVCTNMLKEGVVWDDVHLKAHTIAIEGLLELGILKGDKEEILKSRTSVAFFPHGLGHYLGMDTHDTGGHPNYDDKDSLFKYLRVRGSLPAGSIITVEPGVSHSCPPRSLSHLPSQTTYTFPHSRSTSANSSSIPTSRMQNILNTSTPKSWRDTGPSEV